jgi:hypothetical protein
MEPSHRIDGPEARSHGALRIVLVCQGRAKVYQQAIAEVLGDVAVEALDHLSARSLVHPDHRAVVLRVEPSGEGGGVHQVAEQHGQLPAFGVRGFRCRLWWGHRRALVGWLILGRSGLGSARRSWARRRVGARHTCQSTSGTG